MKILILTNHQSGLYRFRRELLEALIRDGHEVYVSVPNGDFTHELESMGVQLIFDDCMDRRGKNPYRDIKLICRYRKLLKAISPDVVLTYTIKPNIYGGWLCGVLGIPYVVNITGLGTSIENSGFEQKIMLKLYRAGIKNADKVFFQNIHNFKFMLEHRVVAEEVSDILPGSGVNTTEHGYEPYPLNDDIIIFSTIGRIMKDKGIDEILAAADKIKKNHKNVIFRLIGDFDEDYKKRIEKLQSEKIVEYIPFQKNIQPFIRYSHAIIHASYHEGMSNVLLEAASSGRPVIATNVPGCMETYDDGVTGIAFEAKNSDDLVRSIEQFLSLSWEQKKQMGIMGREKMITEFDRTIVINKYIDEINNILKMKRTWNNDAE